MGQTRNRVAVTGIGVVSSLGHDVPAFWEACLRGEAVVEEVPRNWKHYYGSKSTHWSPLTLPDFGSVGLRRSDLLSYDPVALNSIYAADMALIHAGCKKFPIDERSGRYALESFDDFRCGAYVGTGLGCITSTFQNYVPHLLSHLTLTSLEGSVSPENSENFYELSGYLRENPRVLPVASTKCMGNAVSSLLSIRYGLRGANETCVAACSAGTTAIARAFDQIAGGRIDFAVAGGTEYYGDRAGGVFMAFDRLNTLAKPRCADTEVNRPFDSDRTGFLFSQGGACMLVMESLASAQARGARVLAEVKGAFSTADAYSLAALDPEGTAIRRMIHGALSDADVTYKDVDYVNTHGTGTLLNDALEASILEREFPNNPFLNSSKSLLGHTIGACGAFESAITILSIAQGEMHPSINLAAPVRDLNFVITRTAADLTCALSHNFGFGGHNVGLVFGRA